LHHSRSNRRLLLPFEYIATRAACITYSRVLIGVRCRLLLGVVTFPGVHNADITKIASRAKNGSSQRECPTVGTGFAIRRVFVLLLRPKCRRQSSAAIDGDELISNSCAVALRRGRTHTQYRRCGSIFADKKQLPRPPIVHSGDLIPAGMEIKGNFHFFIIANGEV
jgi:hypothetical protein